ncbi:MAG: ribosomal-processing cysteine protease Prp [Bacilli bacterium]|jgi:uncharacterized protein YsxB (DUF464 family)
MVNVIIETKNNALTSLEVSGHASSGPYGQDLVCAAVSAVTIGALNALDNVDDFTIIVNEGLVSLKVKSIPSTHDVTVLETLIISLKTIEATYGEYIRILER